MSARIIDGKTISADLRGKVTDAVHRLRRDRGIVPGLAVVLVGHNPASKVYVRNKTKAVAEAGLQCVRSGSARGRERSRIARPDRAAQWRSADQRHSGAVAAAAADQPRQGHRGNRSGQGRRWVPSAQCRPARQRNARPGAVHAARLRAAGQDRAPFARRAGGGGDRPLQHRRQAGGAIAAGGECDGDHRSFQDGRFAGGVRARGFADRRDGPPGNGPRPHGSSPARP